jgi:hypothetical protein
MDDLSCFGCHKTFTTQKRLSGHEASCDANKHFDTAVYKRQRRLEKEKRKKDKRQRVRKETLSPERREKNVPSSPEADVRMDIDDDTLYPNVEVSFHLFERALH